MSETDPRPGEEHIRRARKLVTILVPALREVARRHGYALGLHGSVERDVDLIAAPWREGATSAADLIADIFKAAEAVMGFATWAGGWTERETFAAPIGSLPNPHMLPYGRQGYSILLSGGPYLDISVMAKVVPLVLAPKRKAKKKPGGGSK